MNENVNILRSKDGKYFYTGLKEGDVAKNILLPGDVGRSKTISELFDQANYIGLNKTCSTYTGTSGDVPISVMSTGMGGMCISVAMEELKMLGVKNAIRVGTGAGVQTDIPPGTLVIATGAVRGEGTSMEYAPIEYPAAADYQVVNALIEACKEFNEEPVVGLYRAHDSFYMETKCAHEGLLERMQPWIDANVKLIENETSILCILGKLFGIRTGTICVNLGPMCDKPAREDDEMSKIYPALLDEKYFAQRIELCAKIAIRAMQKLNTLEDEKE